MNELAMAVVSGRCSKSKQLFGVSFKQVVEGQWIAYWAFPLSESTNLSEGYDQTKLSGTFAFDPKYPGCPYCHGHGHIRCGRCGRLTCWDNITQSFICPWCGNSGILSGSITDLSGSRDL